MDSLKISTITLSTQLPNCKLNIINIGKYLNINDKVVGIKYNFANLNVIKGKYSTTIHRKSKLKSYTSNKILFYNQVTLIIKRKCNECNESNKSNECKENNKEKERENLVNVKIFGNGSLHMTGCKSTNDGYEITKEIYELLMSLNNKKDTILLIKDENGVIVDSYNMVYSYDTFQIIGHKIHSNLYVIHKKEYEIDVHTGMFCSKKIETQRRKFILNFSGNIIGYSKIELLKNKSKFYKNNNNVFVDHYNNLIYYNNETIIGKIIYNINTQEITNINSLPDIFEHDYSCCPFLKEQSESDYNKQITEQNINMDINCINVYFNLNFKINRQKIYNKLNELDYICKYNPESYSGVKLLYKIPLENINIGHCKCNNKCTCVNITFLIFQSGNIIVTGLKNTNQISLVVNDFINICNKYKKEINCVTKEINCVTKEINCVTKEINWPMEDFVD